MGKLMVFPYGIDTVELGRFAPSLSSYESVIPVNIPSSGLVGIDAGIIDGGTQVGIPIVNEFEKEVLEAEAVYTGDDDYKYQDRVYLSTLYKMCSLVKKVFMTGNLKDRFQEQVHKENIQVLPEAQDILLYKDGHYLYDIPVPIVAVLGVGERCNQANIVFSLYKALSELGYSPMAVSSKSYAELLGCIALPDFVYAKQGLEEKHRVLGFNHWLYKLAKTKRPDVIVLEIPGPLMKITPFFFEGIGETAFCLANAIRADIGILSVYADKYTKEYLEELKMICKYRLNIPVKHIHVAATRMNYLPGELSTELNVVDAKRAKEMAVAELKNSESKVFSSFSDEDSYIVANEIIDELANNR